MEKDKKKSFLREFFSSSAYLIKSAFKCDFFSAVCILLKNIIVAIIPSIQVIVVADFLNKSVECINEDKSVKSMYSYIIKLILVIGIPIILDKVTVFFNVRLKNNFRLNICGEFAEKNSKLSYKHIENPKTAELAARVLKLPEDKFMDGYDNLVHFIYLVILIVSIMSIIATQVLWAACLIVISAIPLLYLSIKSGKGNYQMNRDTTVYLRKYQYLGEVLTSRNSVDERMLFNYSESINKVWSENYEIARKQLFKTELMWWIKVKAGCVLTVLVSLIITISLLHPVINGVITIGMFMALINATYSLVNRMGSELANTMDKIVQSIEYISDVKEYLSLSETEGALDLPSLKNPEIKSIEFKNVRFKYPGTEKYILNGINLKMVGGKHYSIVGANGSGKTTITKLLTGLYDEYEGEILINDISIKEYSMSELKSFFSPVYQDFSKYSISLRDNIRIGKIDRTDFTDEDLYSILKQVNADDIIQKLNNNLNTHLGKLKEDGVDLSGGQWQKIALARNIFNDAPFKILDEPTAALDPISESNLYEKFGEVCQNKTTLFISHRLGSTKFADEIFVIDKGIVAENGSHSDLMMHKALYYSLYESQRSWYM